MADFLTIIERSEFHEAHFLAARNLEVIEMLLDENEEVAGGGAELFKSEIHRQLKSLQQLRAGVEPSALARLREEAGKAELLGEYWF